MFSTDHITYNSKKKTERLEMVTAFRKFLYVLKNIGFRIFHVPSEIFNGEKNFQLL